MEPIQLILLDDHAIVRDGIRAMLLGNATIKICGEAADYPSLLKELQKQEPHIIITDIKLGGSMTGTFCDDLRQEAGSSKICLLRTNMVWRNYFTRYH